MADIDKTKQALLTLINVAEQFDIALLDGKLSLSEVVTVVVSAIPGASAIWENRIELVAELKDLDSDELAEVNQFVATELDLSNELAEKKVEKVIAALIALIDMVSALREKPEEVVE
jgi:hypothetical protein